MVAKLSKALHPIAIHRQPSYQYTMPTSDYRASPIRTHKLPPGIGFIVANEAAERFSSYGMRAVLVVFMTQYLLNADGLLGKYRTIILLSLVCCLGHLALAFAHGNWGLALGLGLIAMGAGGIKPCGQRMLAMPCLLQLWCFACLCCAGHSNVDCHPDLSFRAKEIHPYSTRRLSFIKHKKG